ncbi:hypothetical protein, partial [Mycobacterium sp.]|uniref:hypothetical protein n=1 Tax=Mycobacterium sp. TaxID=1785 RepID=UPI003F98894E
PLDTIFPGVLTSLHSDMNSTRTLGHKPILPHNPHKPDQISDYTLWRVGEITPAQPPQSPKNST